MLQMGIRREIASTLQCAGALHLGDRHRGHRHSLSRCNRQITRSLDLPRRTAIDHKAKHNRTAEPAIHMLPAYGGTGGMASRREISPSRWNNRSNGRSSTSSEKARAGLRLWPRLHRGPVALRAHAIRHQHHILHPHLPFVVVARVLGRIGYLRAGGSQPAIERRHHARHVQRR